MGVWPACAVGGGCECEGGCEGEEGGGDEHAEGVRVSGRERREERGRDREEGRGKGTRGWKREERARPRGEGEGTNRLRIKEGASPLFLFLFTLACRRDDSGVFVHSFMGKQNYKRVTRRSRRSWGRTFDLGCPRRQGRPCRWPDETRTIARAGQFVKSGRAEGRVGRAGDSLEA